MMCEGGGVINLMHGGKAAMPVDTEAATFSITSLKGSENEWSTVAGDEWKGHSTDCPQKITIGIILGFDCERSLYEVWKIKLDYETMTIFLQFSEDPSDLAK